MNVVTIIIVLYVDSEQLNKPNVYQNIFLLPESNWKGIEARPCDVHRSLHGGGGGEGFLVYIHAYCPEGYS